MLGAESSPAQAKTTGKDKSGGLSVEEAAQVAKLKQVDRQVRQHELAHLAAAGGMATSGASFTYQKGPDGVNYAVGGEVGIDTSPGKTPEETIRRAQAIRAAALAPADPSGQDRSVAAQATQMEQQARIELVQQSDASKADGNRYDLQQSDQLARHYASNPLSPGRTVNTYA